jgi:hypothetical protein
LKKPLENIQFLCEEKNYTKEEISIFFGDSDKTKLITELKEKKCLDQEKNSDRFRFKYVGIIAYEKFTNCVFPKYYQKHDLNNNKSNKLNEFKQILKVFNKYSYSIRRDNGFDQNTIDLIGSEFILADAIIKDYINSGLYVKVQVEYSLNGEGETNWETTVNRIDPFFTRGLPIYSDVITSNTFIEDDYIITQIHKWAVKYCIKRYGILLEYDLNFDIESPDNLSDIGEDNMLITLLKRERNNVFVDRNIRLLNLLLSLLEKKFNDTQNDLALFGTNSFEHIWQQACALSFNNRLIKTIKIENVISNLPYGSELFGKTFKDIIPQPKWWSKELNETKAVSTLIPDIISVIDDFNKNPLNLNERLFFVLDPKYYNLEFCLGNNNEITIKDNPGVGDIIKQILYEHVYQDKLSEYFNKLYNILLFPKLNITNDYNQNTFFSVAGNVEIDLKIFNENLVWLLWLDPIQIYDSYLKNNFQGEQELVNISREIKKIK